MFFKSTLCLALSAALTVVTARDITAGVQAFYDKVKSGTCTNVLKSGFTDGGSGKNVKYCSDDTLGVMWIAGNGVLGDMDVDCDGTNIHGGKCGNDPTGQDMTAFQDSVQKYGISDLDANIHGYVVLGNSGASPSYDPQSYGIEPLSVVVVVCDGKIMYGVWGDTNGGTSTGESSISLAEACFPSEGISGNNGHTGHDVLYLAFKGDDAKTDSSVDWKASSFADFENSLATIGDKLVAKFGSTTGDSNSASSTVSSTPTTLATSTKTASATASATATCSWAGHCAGATCSSDNDCSDSLVCTNKVCAN